VSNNTETIVVVLTLIVTALGVVFTFPEVRQGMLKGLGRVKRWSRFLERRTNAQVRVANYKIEKRFVNMDEYPNSYSAPTIDIHDASDSDQKRGGS
jgi:hypothetical protein